MWTLEETEKLKETYPNSLWEDILRSFPHKEKSAIQTKAKRLKLRRSRRLGQYCRYYYDRDFFSVPTLLNSYWAGMLGADGCLVLEEKYGRGSTAQVRLSLTNDYDHVNQFRLDIGYDKEVSTKEDVHEICITSAWKYIEDLKENFNLIPNKTKVLIPPSLNEENSIAYIIGYIDGDGSIFQGHNKYRDGRDRYVPALSVAGTEEVLKWIQKHLDFDNKISFERGIYHTKIQGTRALSLIRTLREIDVPKLSRKWNAPWLVEMLNASN
jgi:hypothetical protein